MADLAVIFDLDGTLIDSAPDIHAAVNTVLGEEGLPPLTSAQVRSFVGNGAPILLERCLRAHGLVWTGPQLDRLYQHFIDVYETAHSLTTLYPGVSEALEALSHHALGICTNKPEVPTRSVLAHFELARHFPVIVGGDTLPQRKPDPAPLIETMRRMGSGRAIFVGDSEVDAETAQAAGVPLVLFTQGYRKTPAADMGAAALFSDWTALPDLVRTHFA